MSKFLAMAELKPVWFCPSGLSKTIIVWFGKGEDALFLPTLVGLLQLHNCLPETGKSAGEQAGWHAATEKKRKNDAAKLQKKLVCNVQISKNLRKNVHFYPFGLQKRPFRILQALVTALLCGRA